MEQAAEKLEKLSLELDEWATRLKNEGWSTVQAVYNDLSAEAKRVIEECRKVADDKWGPAATVEVKPG